MTDSPTPVPGAVEVKGFTEADTMAWEAFVMRHSDGSLFQTLRWREALRQIFPHEDFYLIARRRGVVSGVLPLFLVRSLFFGRSLVSVPFGVYGGLLVDDEESARSLLAAAGELAERVKAKHVELRHLHAPVDDLPRSNLYHTFIEDVPDTKEGCLLRIPRKGRAEVRKAIKQDVLSVDMDQLSISELYRLFSLNKRQLGSPIFPESLFWHMKNVLKDDACILTVRHEQKPIAAVMSFIYKDTIMPYYSGTEPGTEYLRANNFMYYELMCEASERGLKRFDFGRSREGTGAFSFKKHQGFDPIGLSYDYILMNENDLPSLNPSNPRYKLAKKAFRRMPLWMARKLGSWLVKRAPF